MYSSSLLRSCPPGSGLLVERSLHPAREANNGRTAVLRRRPADNHGDFRFARASAESGAWRPRRAKIGTVRAGKGGNNEVMGLKLSRGVTLRRLAGFTRLRRAASALALVAMAATVCAASAFAGPAGPTCAEGPQTA